MPAGYCALHSGENMTPDFTLKIDGTTASSELKRRLMSLEITDQRGLEADTITLTLSDHDGKLALPRKGAVIECSLGWVHEIPALLGNAPGVPSTSSILGGRAGISNSLTPMGQFTVDEIEHSGPPDIITITGRSADMREGLTQQRRGSYHDTTLGQIIKEVAGRHQLEAVLNSELDGFTIPHLDQTDESDANLLTRLGHRFDAVATVKRGRLLFMPAGKGISASGQTLGTLTLARSDGDSHRYTEQDRDAKYTGVKAAWQDKGQKQRKYVEVGSDGYRKVLKETYPTEAEATAAAMAAWNRLQRETRTMSLTLAVGNPQINAETPIKLTGYKPEINANAWVVKQVKHQLGDNGLQTVVDLESKV